MANALFSAMGRGEVRDKIGLKVLMEKEYFQDTCLKQDSLKLEGIGCSLEHHELKLFLIPMCI